MWRTRARVQRALGRVDTAIAAYRRGIAVAKASVNPEPSALANDLESELADFLVASGRGDAGER